MMVDETQAEKRSSSTEGGNYNERIGGHYINAENVYLNESAGTINNANANNAHASSSQGRRLAFAIAGSVDEVDEAKLKAITELLQKMSGDTTISIVEIQDGSIRLILDGSPDGLERLQQLFDSGELSTVLGAPVEYVRFLDAEENRNQEVESAQIESPGSNVVDVASKFSSTQSRVQEASAAEAAISYRSTGTGTTSSVLDFNTPSADIGFTHEDFEALLDHYDYHFSPGDIVPGEVFSIEPRGALIDIGAKTAAYLPIQEMSINRVETPDEVLGPNEIREFFILTDENEDGQLTLSIRRIEYMRAWERVRQLQNEDVTVQAEVFAANRGGVLARVEGLRGFIPGSHISTQKPKEDLLGEVLSLKFLEVDEERNRLVLSQRRALVERRVSDLQIGQVVLGTVRGLKPYGAFIDIGGVSGLLHISEISHDHIDTPNAVLKVNDEIKVMIIDLDAERGRISLSTKQLEPEPGDMVNNPNLVFERAEEMAERYRQKLLKAAEMEAAAASGDLPSSHSSADDDDEWEPEESPENSAVQSMS